MKVHLIKEKTIQEFMKQHATSKAPFVDWLSKIYDADWTNPEDMKRTYRTADLLGGGSYRVVFDIGGNNYRMICKYAFGDEEVHLFVCWIGTHKEYDHLCNGAKQYTVSAY